MKEAIKYFMVAFLVLGLPFSASADVITFNLTVEFSGADEPAGTQPPAWLTATFTDVIPGTVRLVMDASNLTGSEFVGSWYFNLNPSLNAPGLSFGYLSGIQASSPISTGVNAFKADGDGYFDIKFDFAANAFADNYESVYQISGSGLDVSDFSFSSVEGGGNGTYFSAAHVQGIGTDGEGSGWIGAPGEGVAPVPVPPSLLLLGSGLIGAFVIRRTLKSSQAKKA